MDLLNVMSTTTSRQTEEGIDWWCSICKKRGHTARHHKMFPDIYEDKRS